MHVVGDARPSHVPESRLKAGADSNGPDGLGGLAGALPLLAALWLGLADDAPVDLADSDAVEVLLGDGSCLGLEIGRLLHEVAALAADAPLVCVVFPRHTHRCAVIIVPHTDAFKALSVVHVVLVMFATARGGLAHRTLLLGASACVCLGVDDGEELVASLGIAACA